jgi:hypothetical protein
VEKLLAARARYGATTAAQVGPECPITAEVSDSEASGGAGERITVTREELEALIEEAVRSDRSRR